MSEVNLFNLESWNNFIDKNIIPLYTTAEFLLEFPKFFKKNINSILFKDLSKVIQKTILGGIDEQGQYA